jgi:hypothetical protein
MRIQAITSEDLVFWNSAILIALVANADIGNTYAQYTPKTYGTLKIVIPNFKKMRNIKQQNPKIPYDTLSYPPLKLAMQMLMTDGGAKIRKWEGWPSPVFPWWNP